MSQPMTTWKEIASYLGKSVRTVQRWERELAMPVHRPNLSNKNVVIVSCEDLNGWIKDQDVPPSPTRRTEEEKLRVRINDLEIENGRLRIQLQSATLDARCELLRESIQSQASRSAELSQTSARLQGTSNRLFYKSRVLRTRKPSSSSHAERDKGPGRCPAFRLLRGVVRLGVICHSEAQH